MTIPTLTLLQIEAKLRCRYNIYTNKPVSTFCYRSFFQSSRYCTINNKRVRINVVAKKAKQRQNRTVSTQHPQCTCMHVKCAVYSSFNKQTSKNMMIYIYVHNEVKFCTCTYIYRSNNDQKSMWHMMCTYIYYDTRMLLCYYTHIMCVYDLAYSR